MELLYIWIEKFDKLKNFEVNFGGEITCSFKPDRSLKIKKNELYIKDFFNVPTDVPSYISNITAIVGENGSGKTSFIECLQLYMYNPKKIGSYIAIFKDKEEFFIDCPNNENIPINIESIDIEINFKYKAFKVDHVIYFSNVFDSRLENLSSIVFKEDNSEHASYFDISTNYLSKQVNSIPEFFLEEFEKQIMFINTYKNSQIVKDIIRIPENVYIDYYILDTDNLESKLISFDSSMLLEELEDGGYFKSKSSFISKIKKTLFIFWLYKLEVLSDKYLKSIAIDSLVGDVFKEFYYGTNGKFKYKAANEYIIDYLRGFKKVNYKQIEKELIEITNIIIEFQKLIIKISDNSKEKDKYSSMIMGETLSEDISLLLQLYKDYFSSLGDFLRFYWSEQLSSGEYAMLALVGRFFSIEEDIKTLEYEKIIYNLEDSSEDVKDNFTFLLIDEGELYFHPQWQKEWLEHFISIIKLLFQTNIQIVLTTHSPFILSDFPNYSTVFLKRGEISPIVVKNLDGHQKTFGANIHELFSNSFFINDGLMGNFAKTKINNLIDLLLGSVDSFKANSEVIKKTIDIIGEPILKKKIMDLYTEKLKLSYPIDLDERINRLEKEMEYLKGLQNKNE